MKDITVKEIEALFNELEKTAEKSGYHLNPDTAFAKDLVKGLLVNEERYGYMACPCRLSYGQKDEDLDIICPCDYRDSDINDFGACYCGLYVSSPIANGEKPLTSIPERRPPRHLRAKPNPVQTLTPNSQSLFQTKNPLPYPVWRCKVCGYLCARDKPPDICPICKVPKERFEKFL